MREGGREGSGKERDIIEQVFFVTAHSGNKHNFVPIEVSKNLIELRQ